jgi:hypothetical protein
MAITVDFLSLENRKALVDVVVDPKDRNKGFIQLQVQDVPWSKWQSLQLELLGAQHNLSRNLLLFGQAEHSREQSMAYGEAMQRLIAAQTDILRWCVSGHAEIFSADGSPVPFDTEIVTFDGVSYHVASAKMLWLYTSIGKTPTKPLTFLAEAALVCSKHQTGEKQLTAEERWLANQ